MSESTITFDNNDTGFYTTSNNEIKFVREGANTKINVEVKINGTWYVYQTEISTHLASILSGSDM